MNSPSRVIYFSRDYSSHDQRFLTSLSKTDYDVYYLRLENKKNINIEKSLPENIIILPELLQDNEFRLRKTPEVIKSLKSVLRETRPDIIHAGPIHSCAFLVALTKYHSLISMSWGSDMLVESEKDIFFRLITWYTLKRTSLFLGDCEAVKNKAIKFGYPEKRIVIFPWGINLNIFKPGRNSLIRQKLGWDEQFVLLSLRSWEKIYGVEVVAKAFVKAAKIEPDLRLFLLGSGSYKDLIKKIIHGAGVEDRVSFPGVIDQEDLPSYYQTADLYLSASFSDGSSVSLMEALGSGLPVLVSDIVGNKEWINSGENGWLFRTGDEEDLAKKIIDIYHRRSTFPQIGEKARETAEQKANWDNNFLKLLSAYRIVLDSNEFLEG